jgi:S1-C subfamily serine protease
VNRASARDQGGAGGALLAVLALTFASCAACATAPPSGTKVVAVPVTAGRVQGSANADPTVQSRILQLARSSVFRVRNESCLATGTAFATNGAIVTNRHVAAGASSLDLATWDGQDFKSEVAAHDGTEDLALLDAVPPGDGYAPLAPADPTAGTSVWVAGYPLGDQLSVASGRVLAVESGASAGLGGPVLEISDQVQHGNSGSPLFDSGGQVVGVVFAIDQSDGDGLAMPVSSLRSFLSGAGSDHAELSCVDLSP